MLKDEITPFSEHRKHLRENLDRVRATGRPLIVTTHGKPDAVVLSAEAYDALLEDAEYARSLRQIRKSVDEFRRGEARPIEDVFARVRRELGLPEDA